MTLSPELLALIKDVKPATDEEIGNGARQALKAKAFGLNVEIDPGQFISLIARIVAERKAVVAYAAIEDISNARPSFDVVRKANGYQRVPVYAALSALEERV